MDSTQQEVGGPQLPLDFEHPRPGAPSLFVRWRPAASSRGVVALIHGFGEHSGRYEHVFSALGEWGLSCLAIDLRGFGRSGGRRGHVARFEDYLDDTGVAVALARERCPGEPLFLLGHSMGGLVCARFSQVRGGDEGLAGLVLTSPAFAFAVQIPLWKSLLGRVASRVVPWLSLPTEIRPEELSHDPTVHAEASSDPLMTQRASARWFTESLAAQARAMGGEEPLPCPLLLLAAGSDSICDPAASRQFLAQAEAQPHGAEGHFYGTLFHEILNEVGREQVLEHLQGWIEGRVVSGGVG